MRRIVFLVSLLLLAVVGWSWFEVHWAQRYQREYAPEPRKLQQVGVDSAGRRNHMTQKDILLQRVMPRDSTTALRHYLLSQDDLFPAEYTLIGLVGATVGLWLLLRGIGAPARREDGIALAAHVLLSGAAGLIAYLILVAATQLVGDYETTMRKWRVFPLLAGLFTPVFFGLLPDLLKRMLDTITKPFGSKSETKAKEEK